MTDVIEALCKKLIDRHPHIYGEVKVKDEEEVKKNWEKLKLKEGNKSVLEGVPSSLPALIKSMRIQEKARGVGFDWDNKNQVWNKVTEELEEFKAEENLENNLEKAEAEFGDLLFALVNYARFCGINPEDALEKTNRKFIRRFTYMEEQVNALNKKLDNLSLEEMDVFWNNAKEKGL
jgi:XTP/dITP diphosphohydrolase